MMRKVCFFYDEKVLHLQNLVTNLIPGDFRFPFYLHGHLKTLRMQLLKILAHLQFQMLI